MMERGTFISVEGIDGAGKSTHVKFICEYLQQHGKQVIITREPGGTSLGEKIRELLLSSEDMHYTTELLLYFASRQELIRQVIAPKLACGVWVIADRFVDASIAYQGGGRMLGVTKVKQVYSLLDPHLTTDLTFLFDVPLALAFERLRRGRQLDRIELESREFFARVQASYHQLAQQDPQRVKTIMTNQPLKTTRELLTHHLDNLLQRTA